MFKEIDQMITELNSSNSNNDKIEVLGKYSDLEKILYYTYSPFLQFYVTSKTIIKRRKIQETTTQFENSSEDELFSILDKLNKRELSGHKALDTINDFIAYHEEYEEIIHMIIDGNLKIRMSSASINKVFPGLIPKFDVALAKKYEEKYVNFETDNYYTSVKVDGCLDYDTVVEFEDGAKEKIGDVVRNKIDKKIKCFNVKSGEVEFCEILNWMEGATDINETQVQWYEIELKNQKSIILTGNHRVWIPKIKAWRRVDELDGEEEFLVKE